jgi:formylglycine-generating enzyme required for sulfatase activity
MKKVVLCFLLIIVGVVWCDSSGVREVEWCSVPAGTFTWGENDEIQTIDYDYEIMKYEVTNSQYMAYLEEVLASGDIWIQGSYVKGTYAGDEYYGTGDYAFYELGTPPSYYNYGQISYDGNSFIINVPSGYNAGDFDDHPVVCVSWFGANAYAKYYGLRLPTQQEWEKAARGMTGYEFPWGDIKSGDRANYRDSGDPWDNATTPVGFYNGQSYEGFQTTDSPSPYGCYDMCGNVYDWTDSFYGGTPPYTSYRVLHGGSWSTDGTNISFHSWYRNGESPTITYNWGGFRCARGNQPPDIPSNPNPANGAIKIEPSPTLTWDCNDPQDDDLTYDVYLGREVELNGSHLVAEGISVENYEANLLLSPAIYYWKVIADDGELEMESEVWSFSTPYEGLIFVEGGTFEMGDQFNEGSSDELPVHEVTLNSFWIGQYEVTQLEYELVMGSNPAHDYGVGDNYPVYYVTWHNAMEYCNALSNQEGLTSCYNLGDWSCDFSADGYRLPTEAEWEYAARGGVNWTDNYKYSGTTDNPDDYIWSSSNSGTQAHEVGTKLPNQLNIYDMSGNVWENCNDWYLDSYYSTSPANNPTGPASGTECVERGGYWDYGVVSSRVALRSNGHGNVSPVVGFRIARANSTPPVVPTNPDPVNGALDVGLSPTLTWECSDPEDDDLTYDVYFGEVVELNEGHLVAEGIALESWDLPDQEYGTTYFWQVIADDGEFETESEVWSFTTGDDPLPVTLTTFTAVFSNGLPVLQWITTSEINNSGWNIYRNMVEDASNSQLINLEFITGAGSTTEQTNYSFLDEFDIEYGETYYYWLESVSLGGESEEFGPITLNIPEEGEEEAPPVPDKFSLLPNYPNPFNPETCIRYNLPVECLTEISIYNIKGEKVITLVKEIQEAGYYSVTWNGRNKDGQEVSSGVYLYRLETLNYKVARSMVLIK